MKSALFALRRGPRFFRSHSTTQRHCLTTRHFSSIAASSLLEAGDAELRKERYAEAAQLFSQTVAESTDPELLFLAHNRLGYAQAAQGLLEEGLASFEKCRDLAASAGDKERLAAALVNLSSLLLQMGKGEEGLELLERAVALREEVCGSFAPETIDGLIDRSRSLMVLGRPEEAWTATEAALERLEECTGDADQVGHLKLVGLSVQVELATRLKRALNGSEQELLAMAGENEHVLQLVATYYASQNDTKATVAVLSRMQETDDVLTQLGMLHMAANEHEQAEKVLMKALRSCEKQHGVQSSTLAKPLWLLALALQGGRKPHDAQRQLLRLLALVKKEKNDEFEARVARQLAIVSQQQGLPNQHLYYLKYAIRLAEPFPELKTALQEELATAVGVKKT